jgi:site-specific recombinase XerD
MKNEILETYVIFMNSKAMKIKSTTLKNYSTVLKNLKPFVFLNNYSELSEMNSMSFMRKFNDALYNQFGHHHIKRHISTLKLFIRFCVNEDLVELNRVREYDVELPRYNNRPVSLSLMELRSIENLKTSKKRIIKVRDLFLFQCYTGISFCDLNQKMNDLLTERDGKFYLYGTRTKSDIEFCVPLTEKAIFILDKYDWNIPLISNQRYNQYLKEMGIMTGIIKNLTTHVGRRTCGQLYLNLGFTIEAVSRMLGHADINTTQKHYARSSFERVHNENLKIVA